MGRTTDLNTYQLHSREEYDKVQLCDLVDGKFSEEFDKIIIKSGCSTAYIVENCRISKTYLNELRRRDIESKKNISRNLLIEVCLTINASQEDLERLLQYASYRTLYARSRLDSYIIWGYLHELSGRDILKGIQERNLWEA